MKIGLGLSSHIAKNQGSKIREIPEISISVPNSPMTKDFDDLEVEWPDLVTYVTRSGRICKEFRFKIV